MYPPSHVLQYYKVVLRETLRNESVPPLRVFTLTKDARDGMASGNFLVSKDMT